MKSDWIGPRIKQKESFEKGATKRKIKEENIYIIGADFNNDSSIKDNDKKESLLGIFLKKHTKSDLFKDFYDTMPKIIIKYAIRLKDLEKYGTFFSKGENFFNSSVFEIKKIHNKDGNLSLIYLLIGIGFKQSAPAPTCSALSEIIFTASYKHNHRASLE